MNAWPIASGFTLESEGGLSDDPTDRGGRTRFGISSKWHPELDLDTLTVEGARQIYYNDYWLKVRGPELPAPLAIALFDFAIHSSPNRAVRVLQRLLDVKPESGVLRELTLAAVNADPDPVQLAIDLTVARADYLGDLAENDPTQVDKIGGWVSRLVRLTALICRLPG